MPRCEVARKNCPSVTWLTMPLVAPTKSRPAAAFGLVRRRALSPFEPHGRGSGQPLIPDAHREDFVPGAVEHAHAVDGGAARLRHRRAMEDPQGAFSRGLFGRADADSMDDAAAVGLGGDRFDMVGLRTVASSRSQTAKSRPKAAFEPNPMLGKLERAKGFEPSTPTLARLCSTPELHPRSVAPKRRARRLMLPQNDSHCKRVVPRHSVTTGRRSAA